MRRLRHGLPRVLLPALALALLGSACGGDAEVTPIDEAEAGDVTDAGAEGAFGEVDDCEQLVDEAVAAYQRVIVELGDAPRTDVDRIDAATESFGGLGPDLSVRAEALNCHADDVEARVCQVADRLEAAGPAAQDLIEGILSGCEGR